AFCAPIWMNMIRPSPASYDASELRLIGIEAEIAFRLGRDLPARAAAYDRAEVTAGAALHPAIEVVDSRYAHFRSLDRLSILADNLSNGGLVYGAAVPDWEKLDLDRTRITVTEDGEPFADSAEGAARDPVAALVDFANLMNGRGGTKAGTFVTTGSWTGMVFTKRGTLIVADFRPLGRDEGASRRFPIQRHRVGGPQPSARTRLSRVWKNSKASGRLGETRSLWRPLWTMNSAGRGGAPAVFM